MHARIVAGRVAELIDIPPAADLAERYHPDVVASLVQVPAGIAVAEGWWWDGQVFAPRAEPASVPPPIRAIAPLAFRRRLAAGTRAALTLAASRALEAGDATLQTWLDDVSACRVVDLDDPELHAAVATLRAGGLITEAEAASVLADGTPEEV